MNLSPISRNHPSWISDAFERDAQAALDQALQFSRKYVMLPTGALALREIHDVLRVQPSAAIPATLRGELDGLTVSSRTLRPGG